ncbi:hypothetical protein HYX58_04050 [Candidatus Dependentiae bacterium]|nr:hypothetical protein [Candidatus Dependentiae bacterium]
MIKRFFILQLLMVFSINAEEHPNKIKILFSKNYKDIVYQDRIRNISMGEIIDISGRSNRRSEKIVQTICLDKNGKKLVSFYDSVPFFDQWYKKKPSERLDANYQLNISSYAVFKRSGTHLKKIYERKLESNNSQNSYHPLIDSKPYHFFGAQIVVACALCCVDSYVFGSCK